ncbi:E3 ubiquitin-protein ligase Topors-like [Danaus plexippus]|uniref:E3 ubiquitin-protein ligase Topors n=1 Tax=Danaus plexippus TaxID=13037 RepID=UPI002AAFEDA5|nr:E3 ubiquitin-protein ligase Topors [Danaus plexippus]XP_032528988.2 E3 ubiquitin-protein ligase Topors [Danaus plexippus]XP_061385677.1 E3 ubiquitin-protein ligase Topors-like [Danaus plexippus]XP_061385678.1 E3 ubiquitin-protein ligase Topors-like [Danaus plexippus]
MDTLSTSAQDDSSGANPSGVKSDDSSPRNESGRGSPPPNCAICLGTCRNKSFTDTCLHEFCFKCLLTWSKVKAVCPLCKQNFRSIIHNVRSNHQYDEYTVEQHHTEEITERIDIDNLTTTRRFRYRTTLTLPRRETIAIQQLLMHYPLMADVFPSPRSPAAPAPSSTAPPLRRRSPASFRRSVYRYNLWARPLPDFTGRFRDCSPEFYRYNDSQIHRLVPWLNRELHYLLNENVGHIAYVIARIIELLPEYHITSSEFRDRMRSYFGDRTRHFLHELYNFASTPYDMTGYDRNVQYTTDPNMSTMVNEVISSSESEGSGDSDLVMISSSEPAEPPPGPSRVPAPVYPNNYIPEPPPNNVIPIETISQSDTDDDSSEVMVVGYIKPPQDRTPEVVDLLGSDSDVIVQETSEQPQSNETPERSSPRVKLTMTSASHSSRRDSSDSDGSAYTPSPPPHSSRQASQDSDASSEKCSSSDMSDAARRSSQPSRTSSSSSSSSSSPSSLTSSYYTSSSESESSDDNVKRKKARRKLTATERNKRNAKKRPQRTNHKNRKLSNVQERKQSKRKSQSGKGVKSSKKPSEVAPEETQTDLNQPGTSGTARNTRKRKMEVKRRTVSRESKRLKSVVSVIKVAGESSSRSNVQSSHFSVVIRNNRDCSDSDDDIPLNLTITKSSS